MKYLHYIYIACIIAFSSLPISVVLSIREPHDIIFLSVPIVLCLTALGFILFPLFLPDKKPTLGDVE